MFLVDFAGQFYKYMSVLVLYITSSAALTAYKYLKNSHSQFSLFMLITPSKSVCIAYVQLITHFGSYNSNHAECGTAGF